MTTTIDQSQKSSELYDKVTEPRRSKWSIVIDTAIKKARKKVSGAEGHSESEEVPPARKAADYPA